MPLIDWMGGNCPVQAEGTIDGEPFYFRARGNRWSLGVGGEDPISRPAWEITEGYGDGPYDAGWMSEAEAVSLIEKAAELWRERNRSATKTETATSAAISPEAVKSSLLKQGD